MQGLLGVTQLAQRAPRSREAHPVRTCSYLTDTFGTRQCVGFPTDERDTHVLG